MAEEGDPKEKEEGKTKAADPPAAEPALAAEPAAVEADAPASSPAASATDAPKKDPEPPPDKVKEWTVAILIMAFLAAILIGFVSWIKGSI